MPKSKNEKIEKATFACGCFWGVQDSFDKVKGVAGTRVGYTGGHVDKPTYEQVCTHATGHAEAIEIEFDPALVSYAQLLSHFFSIHDPTQVNRQGPDVGDNYRSAIFYHSTAQKKEAEQAVKKLASSKEYSRPIATQIVAAPVFWPAEEYHQKYYLKNPNYVCPI